MKRIISLALSAIFILSLFIVPLSASESFLDLPTAKEISSLTSRFSLAVSDSEIPAEEYIKLHMAEKSLLWGLDDPSLPDYQKVLLAETRIAKLCRYDIDAPEKGQYASNALVDRLAVCAGYSNAFKYLMDKLSIKCDSIVGSEFNHEWNIFEIDGKGYFADLANNDGSFIGSHGFQYQFMSGYTFSKILQTMFVTDIGKYMDIPASERIEAMRRDAEALLKQYSQRSDIPYPTEDYFSEDVGQPWKKQHNGDGIDGFVLCGGRVYYSYYDSTLPKDSENVSVYCLGEKTPVFSYNKSSFCSDSLYNQLESDGKLLFITDGTDIFSLDPSAEAPSLCRLDKSAELCRVLSEGERLICSLRYYNGSVLCQVCDRSDKTAAVYEGAVYTCPDYVTPLEIFCAPEGGESRELYFLQYAALSDRYEFRISTDSGEITQYSPCRFLEYTVTAPGTYTVSASGNSDSAVFAMSKINYYSADGELISGTMIRDGNAVSPIGYNSDNIPDGKVFLGWSEDKNADVPEYYKINSDDNEGKIVPQNAGYIDLYPVFADKYGTYRLTPHITVSYNKDGSGKVCATVTADSTIPPEFLSVYSYLSDMNELTVGTGTKTISQNAFIGAVNLEKINLPNTLERIEEAAFAVNVSLKEVTLPQSLNFINNSAFPTSPAATIYYSGDRSSLMRIIYTAPGIAPSGISSLSTSPNVYCRFISEPSPESGLMGSAGYENLFGQKKDMTYFDFIPGDCDMDGKVTFSDALIIKCLVIGAISPALISKVNTDINGDGKITVGDVQLLKCIILGT